ncbi:Fic family protein [Levilactobacillus yonginensis]|uniref:Fic family protein n=1 Tax=Levilactobacillus yonginensis TaxID=1054041 RepID=UPI000F76EE55|nr:Fic family protein [Levilactobacillus yonginensis]
MTLANKAHLDQAAERNLITGNLDQLIYTAGKFENLQTSLLDTQSIINNEPVPDAKPEDVVTIINLQRAFKYVLDLNAYPQLTDLLTINQIIKGGDPAAGKLRTTDVKVALTNDVWLPPLPVKADVEKQLKYLLTPDQTATEYALQLNLYLSRCQLFIDGNMRTALVAANAILIAAGAGLFAIPENKMHGYRSQLQKYYRSGKTESLLQWLYENCVFD